MLEDIIKNNLNKLFQLYTIEAYADFRLTRDSDLDIDEEAEDLMVAIEKSIKSVREANQSELRLPKSVTKH